MSQLKPFRQYDEHDVINLFTFNGTTGTNGILSDAGALMKVADNTGWVASSDQVDLAGNSGGLSLTGKVLSTTWSLTAKVALAGATDQPIGMALVAMRDEDENGEKLIYNPRKAVEMGVVVPGQSIPLLTRGLVIYSTDTNDWTSTTINAGDAIYGAASGELTKTNNTAGTLKQVGVALGAKTSDHWCLIKLDI